MGTDRSKDLQDVYGWNLILKAMCDNVLDLDKVLEQEFGNIITWLELSKAEEEITHIYTEQNKNNNK